MKKTWIVAISGGSGSGKTTLAKKIQAALMASDDSAWHVATRLLSQDSYYIDQSARFDRDGGTVNFDHPSALEFSLLAKHLADLKNGQDVEIPVYDFATHKRSTKTLVIQHAPIIFVDGTLILAQPTLRDLFDESIFLEVDEMTRLSRRLKRDVQERGRTPEGVREQFFKQVKIMHDEFVEPSKSMASILIQTNRNDNQIKLQTEAQSTLRAQLTKILHALQK